MKEIKLLNLKKHLDNDKFEVVEDFIFKDTTDTDDTCFRITLSYIQEENEGQYPLEDILDKYLVYVTDFLDSDINSKAGENINLVLGGGLSNIQKIKELSGKRVYNKDCIEEDGKTYVELVIE